MTDNEILRAASGSPAKRGSTPQSAVKKRSHNYLEGDDDELMNDIPTPVLKFDRPIRPVPLPTTTARSAALRVPRGTNYDTFAATVNSNPSVRTDAAMDDDDGRFS